MSAKTNSIIAGIRELRATDIAIGPELDAVMARYKKSYREAADALEAVTASRTKAYNEVYAARTAKFQALRAAAKKALGLNEEQFEVFLNIVADGQYDFGTDIKKI
jgi:Na+/H+-translocating membrane pyrophosphatase